MIGRVLDPTDFLDDENWHGGYYELAVDLGDRGDLDSDNRLLAARDALWATADLDGPYLDRSSRPSDQGRAQLETLDLAQPPALYGVARLSDRRRIVCSDLVVRETEVAGRSSHDWLDLCLPLGALARIDSRVGA